MNLKNKALEQGLTSEEYDRIVEILGRDPNLVELGIFAVMWSEHCCYKSSRIHLKELPTDGPRVLQGPGENAGLIDLGDDLVLAFKIESHNHPSFIEPYQGAATGVGGILRDIFTMGARPIAVLDSLHFGHPSHEKTSFLVHGVVSGIGGYGNCMGIPTVGGEVHFDEAYNGNILVNAMAVGLAQKDHIHKAIAKGEGNWVVYLGSKTGRDGIHGATMASEEFDEGSEERRPTVQVGDPFVQKLLLEACLEMMQKKLLVGIQDMGAAGISCSTFEMSERGQSGMSLNLDKVPLRDPSLMPYEIFLSESQERMLLAVTPKNFPKVKKIAEKWEIDCEPIGKVTNSKRVEAFHRGEKVVNLPVDAVTKTAPVYDRPWEKPEIFTETIQAEKLSFTINIKEIVLELLQSANLSSRRAVFEQYDYSVGTDTVLGPGADAAVMRIKGKTFGIALTVDSNCWYCEADPYKGTQHVVAECVRNLAAVGAKALAVTNCLNFGNPENPKIMGQLRESIRGLGDACQFFETPVTGGNVSLYNQTGGQNIKPTPTIGMVGMLKDVKKRKSIFFKGEGLEIAVLGGQVPNQIYQSEFARTILGKKNLACPPLDLEKDRMIQHTLLELIEEDYIVSAHDCFEGGMIQALIECCLCPKGGGVGAKLSLPKNTHAISFLFGEFGSRVLISYEPTQSSFIQSLAEKYQMKFCKLGVTQGQDIEIQGLFQIPLSELYTAQESFFRGL